jgi:hypothetical protein
LQSSRVIVVAGVQLDHEPLEPFKPPGRVVIEQAGATVPVLALKVVIQQGRLAALGVAPEHVPEKVDVGLVILAPQEPGVVQRGYEVHDPVNSEVVSEIARPPVGPPGDRVAVHGLVFFGVLAGGVGIKYLDFGARS